MSSIIGCPRDNIWALLIIRTLILEGLSSGRKLQTRTLEVSPQPHLRREGGCAKPKCLFEFTMISHGMICPTPEGWGMIERFLKPKQRDLVGRNKEYLVISGI